MLNFEEFKKYIDIIKDQTEKANNLDMALKEMSLDFGGFYNETIPVAVDLLSKLMGYTDLIEYYIYEANWGERFKEIYEMDGTPIPLKTIEDLYNEIYREYNEKNYS